MGSSSAFLYLLIYLVSFTNFVRGVNKSEDVDFTESKNERIDKSRSGHRLKLIFPLLLRVSARLATLVPSVLAGLLGILVFVLFSKKALIISLVALYLTLKDKWKKEEKKKIILIEKYYDHDERGDYQHYGNHHTFEHHRPYEDHHPYSDQQYAHSDHFLDYYDHFGQ